MARRRDRIPNDPAKFPPELRVFDADAWRDDHADRDALEGCSVEQAARWREVFALRRYHQARQTWMRNHPETGLTVLALMREAAIDERRRTGEEGFSLCLLLSTR
jgi:hypothetical protein